MADVEVASDLAGGGGSVEGTGLSKTITLTETEKRVFDILLETAEKRGPPGLVVRAAGGWVRDKLLGRPSDDVDIVVDLSSGEGFAQLVSCYMGEMSQSGCSRIGVVKQNPDQSKHLATACFTVCGLSLDVNHLRTETYTAESRIPQVSIGTASEDAHRRDFTINSLFYNLNTRSVEDFVGSGLEDLRLGRIRTPLPPSETFEDDPLRMLRAVRFAARLGFEVDEEIVSAAREPRMAQLLESKVSRERVGLEVDKMLSGGGGRIVRALESFEALGLVEAIFMPAEVLEAHASCKGQAPLQASDLFPDGLGRARRALVLLGEGATKLDARAAAFAALLSPWGSLSYMEKKRKRPLIHCVLRGGLRLPNDIAQLVPAILEAASALLPLPAAGEVLQAGRRLQVGRTLLAVKEHWPSALALAAVLSAAGTVSDEDVRRSFTEAKAWVDTSGLTGCWEWKPFIDGKRLMEPPFSVPRGKRLGTLIETQLRWRMEDPALDAAACEQRLLAEEGGSGGTASLQPSA
mmetsp:Transcript_128337/g.411282  ORF Transcript_128337/g.411282 Transcript_128337/m.411282 type:complete len:520 (-) Transcript_128337:151-1710(-)